MMKSEVQDNSRALHTVGWWWKEKVGEKEREREGSLFISFSLLKQMVPYVPSGSVC